MDFIRSIASGKMVNIDTIIRRVDMPVESLTIKLPAAKAASKTGQPWMSALYWVAGLALLLYPLFSLYSSHYLLEVGSAVVSRKTLTLQSSMDETMTAMRVKAGEAVRTGTPLLLVKPSQLAAAPAGGGDASPQSYAAFMPLPDKELAQGLGVIVNFSKSTAAFGGKLSGIQDFLMGDPATPPPPTSPPVAASPTVPAAVCKPALWPEAAMPAPESQQRLPAPLLKKLLTSADAALEIAPQAQAKLGSAGVVDPDDQGLQQTRKALQDSQRSALLAVAYKFTGKQAYFNHAADILRQWASTYVPSGHPIDESRLDSLLWAYDLLKCQLDPADQQLMQGWLKKIQRQKQQWTFGACSAVNNWKTHQLKMQLLLDKLLGDSAALEQDIQATDQQQEANILGDGATLDYRERDALHYHVYDLEAWLEIALIAPKYRQAVTTAVTFLTRKLASGDIHGQFVHSRQAIDEKRAKAGFEYARKGGSYPPEKAARALLVYATANQLPLQQVIPPGYADVFTEKTFEQPLFAYVRYYLWVAKP